MQKFNKRLFTHKQFRQVVDLAMFSVVKKRKYMKHISKTFQNHIMLAVTEVNGCKACTWFHTKIAENLNNNKKQIAALLSGDIKKLPENEYMALLFAQHYADTFGKFDSLELNNLINNYGKEVSEGIIANIRMIMMGNVNGIAYGCLTERLKGRKVENSKLKDELLNLFSILWLAPFYMLKNIFIKTSN